MAGMTFSDRLTTQRKRKGVSQKQAAADLGISQALLSHYENGIREPGLSFLVKETRSAAGRRSCGRNSPS